MIQEAVRQLLIPWADVADYCKTVLGTTYPWRPDLRCNSVVFEAVVDERFREWFSLVSLHYTNQEP